ncbi:MAG: hypothetical protein Ct9H300mP22_7110 [Gammaproteobacteria bacterium]|nr:MAG: hypothetical protein Ct9H300mP22_7110 [Gammaproteobacteria bacterium]
MIIFRYLSKQILQVMTAVTLILLVVGLTSRFIQYLGQAVAGELASDVLNVTDVLSPAGLFPSDRPLSVFPRHTSRLWPYVCRK